MRKTNKKCLKSSGKRSGVLLLTILFITAMALIFITTALTITIATRKRIYENAKADQARLTVTSLSQAVWQAIYSQQINDNMLYNLAYGTGGQGTLVQFDSSTIPGMGQPGSSTTAYFWIIQEANESTKTKRKIGIECKCEIDGIAQYYTMVLQQNKSEGKPSANFNLQVELGDGGLLNSVVVGYDVSGGRNYSNATPYDADDNIIFLHKPTFNSLDNMGFYCTLLTDGRIRFQDAIFTREAVFMGAEAGLDVANQIDAAANSADYVDFYFWGTTYPIYRSGSPSLTTTNYRMSGINSIYFDRMRYNSAAYDPSRPVDESNNPYPASRKNDADVISGFEGYTQTFASQNLPGTGTLYYDYEITGITNSGSAWTFTSQGSASSPWEPSAARGYGQYLITDPNKDDTIDELLDHVVSESGAAAGATELTAAQKSGSVPVTAGTYMISSSWTVTSDVTFDVTSGPITLYIDESISMNSGRFIIKSNDEGQQVNNDLTIVITKNHMITLFDNSGIVDDRCFNGAYTEANINQTKTPRCVIYSLSTRSDSGLNNECALYFGPNNNHFLTAYVAFYPVDSDGDGIGHDGGGALFGGIADPNDVIYGRFSVGGIYKASGNFFRLPYCPSYPSTENNRGYAYRDNTDYSVVGEESGYFTI